MQDFGDRKERGGGVVVPSVLCRCSVRGESGARGMHRAAQKGSNGKGCLVEIGSLDQQSMMIEFLVQIASVKI
jgi:hypothetical protein